VYLLHTNFLYEAFSQNSSLCSFLNPLCYLVPLIPNCDTEPHTPETPQAVFLLQCERPSFTLIQNNRQIMDLYIYILIFLFLYSKLEDKGFCTQRQQAFPALNLW